MRTMTPAQRARFNVPQPMPTADETRRIIRAAWLAYLGPKVAVWLRCPLCGCVLVNARCINCDGRKA